MNPPNQKLPFREKVGYGMGAFAESVMQNAVIGMTMPIFNILLGVDPRLLGYSGAIARVWDSLTDPAMGFLSDNTRSRWGRRKPYILCGAMLSALSFILIWSFPAGKSSLWYFVYFTVTSLIYYSFTTMYCIPYLSMGSELSRDYHERTGLMGYRMFFVGASGILMGWMFKFTQLSIFPDGIAGMRVLSVIVGLVFVGMALGPLLLTRERSDAGGTGDKAKVRLVDVFSALKVRPFLLIALAIGVGTLGWASIGALGTYILIYHVGEGSLAFATYIQGINGTVGGIVGVAVVPLISLTSKRLGKKRAMLAFFALGCVGMAGSWWFYTPDHPYLSCLVGILAGPCMSALYMLLLSMNADICEWDRYHNNLSRAGVFSAVISWMIKVGITLSMVLAGYILVWTGFSQELGVEQAPGVIRNIRLCYALVPTVGFLIGAIAVACYPLHEKRMREIREALDARTAAEGQKLAENAGASGL